MLEGNDAEGDEQDVVPSIILEMRSRGPDREHVKSAHFGRLLPRDYGGGNQT